MTFSAVVLTIFSEMFPGFLQYSLAGKALKEKIWSLEVLNIRSFSQNKHSKVDDNPYGGGPGLVMRPDVVSRAIDAVLLKNPDTTLIYMTPSGVNFNQSIAKKLTTSSHITIICGRYEGVDQRVIDAYNPYELSVGDYILLGGEPAAMIVLDSCIRLLSGVVNNLSSLTEESFSYNSGVLEYPQYTRPKKWRKYTVPEILLSGNHKKINDWKQEQSCLITHKRRPDLLNGDKNGEFTRKI